jgi:hypothetical protein
MPFSDVNDIALIDDFGEGPTAGKSAQPANSAMIQPHHEQERPNEFQV